MSSRFSQLFVVPSRVEMHSSLEVEKEVVISTSTQQALVKQSPAKALQQKKKLSNILLSFIRSRNNAKTPKINSKSSISRSDSKSISRKTSVKRNATHVDSSKTRRAEKEKKKEKKGKPEGKTILAARQQPSISTDTLVTIIDVKHPETNSIRDSKFSSLSTLSLQSSTSLTSQSNISQTLLPTTLITPPSLPLITLPRTTLLKLQSLTRRATRTLQKQEYLTEMLSANLAYLMARREWAVEHNLKLSGDKGRDLRVLMNGLRGLVGKTFLRKAVFMQRSWGLVVGIGKGFVQEVEWVVEGAVLPFSDDVENKDGGFEKILEKIKMNRSTDQLATIHEIEVDLNNGNRKSVDTITTTSSEHTLINLPTEIRIPLDTAILLSHLTMIKSDLTVQSTLDRALREGIVGPCQDLRLPATPSERVDMDRFVVFLDGRLKSLREVYDRLRGLVVEIEECFKAVGIQGGGLGDWSELLSGMR